MIEALEILTNASLWSAVLRIATPLIFGVLGALLCERVGVLNLAIEGIMTMGAMIGWLSVYLGADLWTGLAIAAVSGAVIGLLHAFLTVSLSLSQHVSGLGITLFASSLAYFIYRLVVNVGSLPPTIEPFQPLELPMLSDLPFFGEIFFSFSGFIIITRLLKDCVASNILLPYFLMRIVSNFCNIPLDKTVWFA